MNEPILFYADEHLPRPVSQGVRRRGIDLLTTQEAGRCGSPDAEQLTFATAQQRVIITFDTDYLVLHQSGLQHAGIACVPSKNTTSEN